MMTSGNIVENNDDLLSKFLQSFSINLVQNVMSSISAWQLYLYCQEVVDNGGLQFLHDILVKNTGEAELITLIIKVLAENDEVKDEVGMAGGSL